MMSERVFEIPLPPDGYVMREKIRHGEGHPYTLLYWEEAAEGEADPTTQMRDSVADAVNWIATTKTFCNEHNQEWEPDDDERAEAAQEIYHYADNWDVPVPVIDEIFELMATLRLPENVYGRMEDILRADAVHTTILQLYPDQLGQIEQEFEGKFSSAPSAYSVEDNEFWNACDALYEQALYDFGFAQARSREIAYLMIFISRLGDISPDSEALERAQYKLTELYSLANQRGLSDEAVAEMVQLFCVSNFKYSGDQDITKQIFDNWQAEDII